jgi:hypothetical protein
MTAVLCHNAAYRKADTWVDQLVPFTRLEFAVSDAAKGITRAVAQVAAIRRDDPSSGPSGHCLDVFRTTMEAHRVLARHRGYAEALWEPAKAANVKFAAAKLRGLNARGAARTARAARAKAIASFEPLDRLERT